MVTLAEKINNPKPTKFEPNFLKISTNKKVGLIALFTFWVGLNFFEAAFLNYCKMANSNFPTNYQGIKKV